MKTILPFVPRSGAEPPLDSDLEAWARTFVLSPAITPRERHERFLVAQLLADLEAQR